MLNHQHQHSSTQNPLRLPTKYAMAFGMVRRPAESAALRVWRVTWNHSHAAWPALSEKGYPATLIIYTHISWLPPTKSWFSFRLPWRANSPPHKRISAKKQHESHGPGFLAGNLAFKMAMAQSLCTKETRNIILLMILKILETSILETSILGVNAFDPPPNTSHNWCLDKAKGQQNHSHAAQPNKPWLAWAGRMEHARVNDLYKTPLAPLRGVILGEMYLLLLQNHSTTTLKKQGKLHPHQDHGGFIIPDRGTVMATRHRCYRSQFTTVEKLLQKVEKKKKHRARRTCKWLGSTLGVTLAFKIWPFHNSTHAM